MVLPALVCVPTKLSQPQASPTLQ